MWWCVTWEPREQRPGFLWCTDHQVEFENKFACPLCGPGDFVEDKQVSDAEALHAQAVKMKLPTELEHERDLHRDYKLARAWALRAARGKDLALAQRIIDTALKIKRAHCDLTQVRMDWLRTERAALLALGLKRRTHAGNLLVRAARAQEAVSN